MQERNLCLQVSQLLGELEPEAYLQGQLIATQHVLAYTISLRTPENGGYRSIPLLSCISQKTGYNHNEIRNLRLSREQMHTITQVARRFGADASIDDEFNCQVFMFSKQ